MCNDKQYDLAVSFWTVSFEYLMLVENVARETVAQGNTWFMTKDWEDGPITADEYAEGTRWSDHTLIIPLLFNLYHGIELLVKGFLLIAPNQNVKPKHGIGRLCRQFTRAYPDEKELIDFLTKFTDEQRLPALLGDFLRDNGLTLNDLYQAVRYPSDQDFHNLRTYVELKYKGENGLPFFKELSDDIKAIRIAAVKLGRSLESHTGDAQQEDAMIGTWEIQNLDAATLDLELAMANLDASVNLCKSMNVGSLPRTFHHAKVIMSLAYHGVELFMKHGIRKKGQDPTRHGHDLRKLRESYQDLNPTPDLHFEVPFVPAYLGFTKDQLKQRIDDKQPLDQHLRYHLDQGGNPWPEAHGFLPDRYISELTLLRDRLRDIANKISGQQGARGDK